MLEDPFSSLSFIAGPAILTNACAVLQNGATTRYSLAISQWRDFRASMAAGDGRVALQYTSPEEAVKLAGRRVRLLLRSLGLLNGAMALFAGTTVLGLTGAFLAQGGLVSAAAVSLAILLLGSAGLVVLLGGTTTFFLESSCGGALLRLHREFGGDAATNPGRPTAAV
ncbi:DUF2721 domain-containing protein [Phenylobacterium deserti]|uniref:DUF2721 domain-containing protein n=1 Tax=Phenylobacterium deserti TaxID=1914756 RepID=A0A328ADB0_9CAUL|nr:DUF2721 domain-containing protein [Phenylobacterium deserti]RAK52206.1 hypothetical protein DJ018_13735 [Phenylobacterium deserti]